MNFCEKGEEWKIGEEIILIFLVVFPIHFTKCSLEFMKGVHCEDRGFQMNLDCEELILDRSELVFHI